MKHEGLFDHLYDFLILKSNLNFNLWIQKLQYAQSSRKIKLPIFWNLWNQKQLLLCSYGSRNNFLHALQAAIQSQGEAMFW